MKKFYLLVYLIAITSFANSIASDGPDKTNSPTIRAMDIADQQIFQSLLFQRLELEQAQALRQAVTTKRALDATQSDYEPKIKRR